MTMNQNFDFNAIIQPAHKNSRAKGFWDDCRASPDDPDLDPDKVKGALLQKLLLIMTEVGEAYDEVRKGEDLSELRYEDREFYDNLACETVRCQYEPDEGPGNCPCKQLHKPIGYASELADILIRIADLYGAVGYSPSARILSDYIAAQLEPARNAGLSRDRWVAMLLTDVSDAMAWYDGPRRACAELAGAVYAVLVVAKLDNIDIGAAVEAKMAYNRTRPVKHGKRF